MLVKVALALKKGGTRMETAAWFMMGLAWGIGIGSAIMFFSIRLGIKRGKREATLFRRLNLKFAGFDEEECKEHHLPGDCPLCGAK